MTTNQSQASPPALKVPGSENGNAADGTNTQRPGMTPQLGAPSASGEGPPLGTAIGRLAAPLPLSAKTDVKPSPKTGPAPLGRVIGNRDFIITIACYGEGAAVAPGGASFRWQGKTDAEKTDETLVRTIIELVRRRQATVRAGEPPYRPVLRFEVHENGRRTYYHVFPLLENLRLPMVRDDVEES